MNIILPIARKSLPKKLDKKYQSLIKLVKALEEKDKTAHFVSETNAAMEDLNAMDSTDQDFPKQVSKVHTRLTQLMLKEMNYVTKNYHQGLWMSLGMTVFGLPIGLMFGSALDSMAYLGLGLPIGMSIGMTIGASLDQKANKEGRQIEL